MDCQDVAFWIGCSYYYSGEKFDISWEYILNVFHRIIPKNLQKKMTSESKTRIIVKKRRIEINAGIKSSIISPDFHLYILTITERHLERALRYLNSPHLLLNKQ